MKSDSSSPWKWNRAISNNFHSRPTDDDDHNKFSLSNIFRSGKEQPPALLLEVGGGAGVGCGVGLGFGLVGGIGHGGASPWNHLRLVFGLGLGCGVGLGLGIGQGIGYGFAFDSLDSYFSDHKSSPKYKPPLIRI